MRSAGSVPAAQLNSTQRNSTQLNSSALQLKCTFVKNDKPCGSILSRRHVGVLETHLGSHGITKDSNVDTPAPTVKNLFQQLCPTLSLEEKTLLLVAFKGWSALTLEDELFQCQHLLLSLKFLHTRANMRFLRYKISLECRRVAVATQRAGAVSETLAGRVRPGDRAKSM